MQQLQQDRNHVIDELMAYLRFEEQFQNECSIEQVSRTRCRHLVGRGHRRDAFRRRRIRRYSVCAHRTSVQTATANGWNLRKLGRETLACAPRPSHSTCRQCSAIGVQWLEALLCFGSVGQSALRCIAAQRGRPVLNAPRPAQARAGHLVEAGKGLFPARPAALGSGAVL